MPTKQIFVVQGPTASGKTGLAISLAKRLKTEIISFDSRQFYHELTIGVARPSIEELQAIQHHFIASHSIENPLNAAQFAALASPILEQLLQKNGSVVLVGGSSLYADALLLGLDPIPHDPAIQQKWQTYYQDQGLSGLQEALKARDFDFFQIMDQQNPVRLIRALEIHELTGQSNLIWRKGPKADPPNVYRCYINWPRDIIYSRIDRRVEIMIEEGLENEVFSFYPMQKECQALQTVGYSEFFEYFDAKISKEEAVEKIKQHSRNYAKRQLTWLRRYAQIHALDPLSERSLLTQVLDEIG